MAFRLSFKQIQIMESLPLTEKQFEKVHGITRNALWDNDLIEKDEYEGQKYIALNDNGKHFLEVNRNGLV